MAGAAAAGAPALAAGLEAFFLIAFFLMDPLAFDLDALAFLALAGFFAIRIIKNLKIYEELGYGI